MPRLLIWFTAAVVLGTASLAWGQSPWPVEALELPADPAKFPRGSGSYFSLFKLGVLIAIYLFWVRMLEWVNRDSHELRINYRLWHPILLGSFLAALALSLLLPSFWLAAPLMIASVTAPLWFYIREHNQKAPISDRVLTREHIRGLLAEWLAPLGIKIETKKRVKGESPVKFTAQGGGSERNDNVNLLTARQMPMHSLAGQMLAEAIGHRATTLLLDVGPESAKLRYQIDGVWSDAPAYEADEGAGMLAVFKKLSALDEGPAKQRQEGAFLADYQRASLVARLTVQATRSGERALLRLDDGVSHKARLNEIGMRDRLADSLKEVVGQSKGMVLVSAPPGGGLTTILTATVAAVDRFMRSAVTIEEQDHPEITVENVPATFFRAREGQTPGSVLGLVLRQYPDVLVVPDVVDADSLSVLSDQAADSRLVITSVRARDASEALRRLLMYNAPSADVARGLSAVVNMRLVRKLCDKCKEGYRPPDTLFKQLGIPPDKVEQLYRAPEPPPADDPKAQKSYVPCKQCEGSGYYGQTGLYEVLIVDKAIRELVAQPQPPSIEVLRKAARAAGMRTLQEEGVLQVIAGVTSLPELMRVLREKDAESESSSEATKSQASKK